MTTQTHIFGGAEVQLVTAKRLAVLLEVSDQSIYNWSKAGLPSLNRDGVRMFEVGKCREWLKANQADFVAGGAKGGKRENAGRKKVSGKKAAEKFVIDASGSAPVQPVTMQSEQQPPSAPIKSAADLLQRMGDGTLQGVESRNLRDQAAAVKTLQEVERRSGTVLQADQVEEAWSLHMRTLKTRLESLVERSTGAIAGALALAPEVAQQVREIIHGDMDAVFAVMAQDPIGNFAADAASEEKE